VTRNETGYLEFPGSRIYYEVDGEGPALTFIHACVAHLRMWDAQVDAFKGRYTVVRFDLRGFGKSTTSRDVNYSNRDDLRRLLDHLGIEQTHMVGNSCGGSVALDFALDYPAGVRSLTLVASGLGGFEGPEDPRAVELEKDWDTLYEAKDYETIVENETREWTDGPGHASTRVDPEMRRKMVEWNLDNYRADQENDNNQRLDPPAASRLSEINVPTLVTWGLLDVTSIAVTCEKLASEIAGAQTKVYPDVAHMVSLEKPAEFNALLGDFLARVDQSTLTSPE
jgi:pimeloyl-ACP methyl ester carboxylesterase